MRLFLKKIITRLGLLPTARRVLNLYRQSLKRSENSPMPEITTALIACARDEGPYILEWVIYHRAIGFDRIILCSHDNQDGSDVLLQELSKMGLIEYYDYTGQLPADQQIQEFMYNSALDILKKSDQTNWTTAIDLDEFIVLKRHKDIGHLIRDYEEYDAISIPWNSLGSQESHDGYEDELVTERFTNVYNFKFQYKTIAKTALIKSWVNPHTPDFYNPQDVSTLRKKPVHLQNLHHHRQLCNDIVINHYMTKSFQEFFAKRSKGGGTNYYHKLTQSKNIKRRASSFYFCLNTLSFEKSLTIQKTLAFKQMSKMIKSKKLAHTHDIHEEIVKQYKKRMQDFSDIASRDRMALDYLKKNQPNNSFISCHTAKWQRPVIQTSLSNEDIIQVIHNKTRTSKFLIQSVIDRLEPDEYLICNKADSLKLKSYNLHEYINYNRLKFIFSTEPLNNDLDIPEFKRVIDMVLLDTPYSLALDFYYSQFLNDLELGLDEHKAIKKYKDPQYFRRFVTSVLKTKMRTDILFYFNSYFFDNSGFSYSLLKKNKNAPNENISTFICDNVFQMRNFIDIINQRLQHAIIEQDVVERYQDVMAAKKLLDCDHCDENITLLENICFPYTWNYYHLFYDYHLK